MALKSAIIVAAYLLLCMAVAQLGHRRKWGFWGYLWSSVLFTPVFGLLFVLAADAPPKKVRFSRTVEPNLE